MGQGEIKPNPGQADAMPMEARPANANDLILRATLRETRETLVRWRRHPLHTMGRWLLLSLAIAVTMLAAVLVVAHFAKGDPTNQLPRIISRSQPSDVLHVFFRNSLVLALHGFVCLAGFMAMRALPEQTKRKSGIDRWVHEHASRFAMLWVTSATIFSITTQIYVLGHNVSDLALTLRIPQWELLATVLPHAVLELTAVFLPLAAFLIASSRRDWHELLAATVVTVTAAVPMLVLAAWIEAYRWPALLRGVLL